MSTIDYENFTRKPKTQGDVNSRENIENPSIPLSSSSFDRFFEYGRKSASGVVVTEELAITAAPVWAAINFISSSIATLPLQVFQKNMDGKREKHPGRTYQLLHEAPNAEVTSYAWRKMLMQDTLLYGRSITLIDRSVGRQIKALYRLDPRCVMVEMIDRKRKYTYRKGDKNSSYEAADIIDIPWMLSPDGVSHENPILTMKGPIGLYIALEDYASKFFQNGGIPPLQLTGPTATVAGAKRSEEDIIRHIAKGEAVMALPAGFEVKPIGIDPNKMQMEEARMFQLGEIARLFGLPKIFLQDLTGATYSNTEQQDLHFVKHSLSAWITLLEQEFNLKLFSGSNDKRYAEFNLDGLLRGDFATRMKGYAASVQNAIMTPNEIRAKENLPAMPDGDELLIQGATVPLGTQPVMETEPEEEPEEDE